MLLRSLKSDWIANFSILANLSTNWDTVEIFFLLLFYISRGDTWGCFFFLRRKQSRIISVSRINLHQCKFFYSVWLSFPSPFSHHFAQRIWDIEELISDLKTALCRDLSSLLCTHEFVLLCTQWVFVFVSMLCVWSCGSSVHDIAVIKEVNSSLCICVCVWVSPWRASVAVREQWDACWTNQTHSTTVWIRHIGGTKGQGLLAAVKTAIQTSPSLHSAKGIVQIPPPFYPPICSLV